MALKYPDRLESNNPAAYGIVKATEISGHRTVQSVDDLYSLADAILSDSGNNTNNDAIGQKWYVINETKEYKLIDWNNRKSSAGWEQVSLKTINGESILGSGDIELADKAKVDELDHYRNWYRYGAARAASLYSLTTSSSSEDIKAALTDIQGNDPKQAGLDECIQKHLQLAEYVMGGTVMVGWSGHGYILTYVGQLNPKSEVYACTITINAVDSDGNTTYSVVRDGVKIKVDSNYLPLTGGTMTGNIIFSSPTDYEYVDLGLPSGLLWAKYNVGATSEEEAGLYFQWGDTKGYTAEQIGDGEGLKAFSSANYKWSVDGSSSNFSKYNASDSKTVLDLEDDAAHVVMGGNWRMPTFDECEELYLNTDIYLVPTEGEEIQGTAQEQSGGIRINWVSFAEGTLKGIKFYKKGDKQTYMFVPTSGSAINGSVQGADNGGNLWTSSLYSSVRMAWFFSFNKNFSTIDSAGIRYFGRSVRGVWNRDNKIEPSGIIIENKSDQDLLNAAGGTTPISDILSSTEGSLSDLEARVKANEDKLVIVQGEETVDGSIKKALKDAKDYTDSKLAWTILE